MDLGTYEGIFNSSNELCGFKPNAKYVFELDKKPNSPYEIYEVTGLYLMLSSEISIRNYFKDLKKVD